MTEAAKEARRQYRREWNKTHKENIKRHQATYWEKKAREAAEATAAALTEDQSGSSSGSDPEDIAIEAQRPHEEAMERRGRREAAAGRTANSSERGRGV